MLPLFLLFTIASTSAASPAFMPLPPVLTFAVIAPPGILPKFTMNTSLTGPLIPERWPCTVYCTLSGLAKSVLLLFTIASTRGAHTIPARGS